MDIAEEDYCLEKTKISKSNYKKYFGKGKEKINMNSCCCHFPN